MARSCCDSVVRPGADVVNASETGDGMTGRDVFGLAAESQIIVLSPVSTPSNNIFTTNQKGGLV